jgi:hypothetical protein
MTAQQKKNLDVGDKFENHVLDTISDECVVAGIVNETSGGHSTPDLVCLQDTEQGYTKTRLIEAKVNKYVKKDQRKELSEIADRTPHTTEIEIAYPDKDGHLKLEKVKHPNTSKEEVKNTLDTQFNSPDKHASAKLKEKLDTEHY